MKILKLRLKGFIGVKEGLGLDEIELDFSGLSGLIAMAGSNGMGKTTILDNMHPYRQLASRSRSLKHHTFLRDSSKEFDFEFHGDQYRTLIKIDAESERSEGFIWKNGESLVDGKVTKYDKAIVKLFGSSTLFFNSVFCAQNSKKLDKMTTGDLKKLFSEFLQLDKLVEYENTSKQCANILFAQAEKIQQEIDALGYDVGTHKESVAKLKTVKVDRTTAEQRLAELTTKIKDAEARLADIQADIQKNELVKVRLKGLQDNLDRIDKELLTDKEQSNIELNDFALKFDIIYTELSNLEHATMSLQKAKDHKQEHEDLLSNATTDLKLAELNLSDISTNIQKNEVIETQVKGLKDTLDRFEKEIESDQEQSKVETDNLNAKSQAVGLEIVEMESLVANEAEIREASELSEALISSIVKDKHSFEIISDEHVHLFKSLNKKEAEKSDFSLKQEKLIGDADRSGGLLSFEIDQANSRAADLDKRDPACKSSTCSFIVSALSAQEDLPKLKDRLIVEMQEAIELKHVYDGTIKTFNAEIEALREQKLTKTKEKDLLKLKITEAESELEKAKTLAAELPKVETALSRKKDLEKRKDELAHERIRNKEIWVVRISDKKHQEQQAKDSIDKAEVNIDTDAKKDLMLINIAVDMLKKTISDMTDKIKDLSQIIISTNIDINKKENLEKRKAEIAEEGAKAKTAREERIAEKEKEKKITERNIKFTEAEINQGAEDDLSFVENNIYLIKKSINERTSETTKLSASILSLEKEVSQKEQAIKDFESKHEERNRIVVEIGEWTYMKNACPGIRVLEIDSVAPVVTGYANDLMLSTFGTGETIKIRTLDEETNREIFDILVIRENGKEVLLDDLSGGEKVWNLKALRLAMTQIAKEKSGKNFLSAMADEDDGSLDVENAKNFVRLYRAFMPSGEFNDCYFISHKTECVAMADHVIEFGNGRITIN